MSFEDVRNALVVAYANDSLDDEELLILYDFYLSVNTLYIYIYIYIGILIRFVSIHSSVSKSSSRTGFLKYPVSGN